MNLSTLIARTKAYEAEAAKGGSGLADRAALAKNPPSADEVVAVLDAFPSDEKFAEFVQKMPKTPGLDAVIVAFKGDEAGLGKFVNDTLSGNVEVLSALAASGCDRDPDKLKAFADAFRDDPKSLQDMLSEGGFGENPEAMAAVFVAGCDGKPGDFKTFCGTFGTPDVREKLGAALNQGGLGMAPDALGGLAKDGGALLKKLSEDIATDTNRAKLNELLTGTSLDGTSPGRPELLKDIITDGLGGDPKRLLELHGAFACDTRSGAADLDTLLQGFDGDDGKGGKRMATLLGAYKRREPGLSNAELAKKMKDPYLSSISNFNAANAAQTLGGAQGTGKTLAAVIVRAMPDPTVMAGQLGAGIPADRAGAVLCASLSNPKDRATIEGAAGLAAGLDGVADQLLTTDAAGDAEQTPLTQAATKSAEDAAVAMDARIEGASPTEIAALVQLADDAIAAAALEPDVDVRRAAVDAAKHAGRAAQTAMARAAAKAMANGAGAAAAIAAQAALAALPATLPQAVKDQAQDYADIAMTTATQSAACTQGAAQSATVADAALAALKTVHGDTVPPAELDAAKGAATDAASAATAITKMVQAAARPVDPALLRRAEAVAAEAQAAATACPDAPLSKAAFEAAAATLAAIADAVREAAVRFENLRLRNSTAGKAALKAAAPGDAGLATADKVLAPGTQADILSASLTDIGDAKVSRGELDTYALQSQGDQEAAAKDAARKAAIAEHGPSPDLPQIDAKATAFALVAETARDAADVAREALAKVLPGTDPAAYNLLIKDAATKGKAAFQAAQKVVENGARALTLTAAEACFKAIEDAAKLPAFSVLEAALSAKADLDVATTSARNAAMTAADAEAMVTLGKDQLEAAAKQTAYRMAAQTKGDTPTDLEVANAVSKADQAAVDATSAAETARIALDGLTLTTNTADYATKIKALSDTAEAALKAAANAVDETKRNAARDKAKQCAAAAADAAKALALHHQVKAREAAFKKQNADMTNVGGPRDKTAAAGNAQSVMDTHVAINTQAALDETDAHGKIGYDPTVMGPAAQTVSDQIQADRMNIDVSALTPSDITQGANRLKSMATSSTTKLNTTVGNLNSADLANDPSGFAAYVEDVRSEIEKLRELVKGVVDDTARDAAYTALEAGAKALQANLVNVDTQTQAHRDDLDDSRAEALASFARGKDAITDAASAELVELAETDGDVRALRDTAEEKQALAELPGADLVTKLDALVATRNAAIKLAEKAQKRFNDIDPPYTVPVPNPLPFGALIGGLAAPSASASMPANMLDDIQKALTAGKAATSAYTSAFAVAQKVKVQSEKVLATLKAIKKQTPEEIQQESDAAAIVIEAGTKITELENGQDYINKATSKLQQQAAKCAANVNRNGHADKDDFLAAAGFAASESDAFKLPPISEADMIRVAPSLVNIDYPGPPMVDTTVDGNAAIVDMEHIAERHMRGTYQFDHESCPKGSEKDLGWLLNAKLAGQSKSAEDDRLIREAKRAKPNSFFPETVDATVAKRIATQAMEAAEVNAGGPPDKVAGLLMAEVTGGTPWARAFHQDDNVDVDIPPTINTTIGIAFAEDPGPAPHTFKLKARMFYPNSGDKLSTPDVLAIAKALGVSK